MKGDIRMGAPINLTRIFRDEPYKSIVNLLAEYRDGLHLKHIQYAISEEPCLKDYTVRKIEKETDLEWKIKDLISSGKIKKHRVKQIKNAKKEKQQDNEGKKIRNNLYNMLKKMMMPPNKVIYRENGKYKLYDISIGKLFADSDKKSIDKLNKLSMKNLEGGRLNIYGLLRAKGSYFNPESKENIERFNNAIGKLREGIDELQTLMDESIGYYMTYDTFGKYINDEKYSVLDRNLLKVLQGFLVLSFKSEDDSPLVRWFDFEDEYIVVSNTDKALIDIFKKHFYPDKKVTEIKSMLKGYVIDEEISNAFYASGFFHLLRAKSQIVAVIHSGGGHFIDATSQIKQAEKNPSFIKKITKFSSELNGSYEQSYRNYFNKQEADQRDIEDRAIREAPDAKERIDEMMKLVNEKKIQNIDDYLDLQKKLIQFYNR